MNNYSTFTPQFRSLLSHEASVHRGPYKTENGHRSVEKNEVEVKYL